LNGKRIILGKNEWAGRFLFILSLHCGSRFDFYLENFQTIVVSCNMMDIPDRKINRKSGPGRWLIIAVIIYLICLLMVPVSAQVNTEALRLGRGESGFSGNIKVAFSIDLGNSSLTELELNPDLVWRGGKHQVFSINEITNVKTDSGSILNKGFAHLRYNFDLTQRLIPEMFVQIQYDRSQKLSERYLAGGGLRIVAIKTKNFLLAFGVIGMFERENLLSGETSRLARVSDYVSLKAIKKDLLSISSTVYVQPAVSHPADTRILLNLELAVSFIKHLSLK
jgi:hypothetical protein